MLISENAGAGKHKLLECVDRPLPRPSALCIPIDKCGVRHIVNHMKTATVRELRNEFPRIEAWVHEGESVNISKRGKVVARLIPAHGATETQPRPPKVDIMARLRETWGGRVFTQEQVAAMRADELAGDLG
jgi:antitoxin (DNA-binding transcriptional repressor) of toxin-antitoxin stability system